MSIDLATLGIKVDATEADKAGVSLDRLATAGGKAEKATAALTGAMNNAKSATAEAERSISGASNSASAMAERAARLKASVDPLGAALDRVNGEMAEAETLYSRGAISASHYADAQTVLTARAERLRAAQADANRMLAGGAGAARLTSNEMLNLSRQASDVGGGGGKGASATASADKAVDAYTGPRDEYGAPTSSYSVLKPGRTVAGNDNGYAPTVGMAPASRGGDTFSASYTIDARGAEAGVEDRIRAVLEANEDRVVQRARQVSAADRAAGATRQRIGGS